MKVASTLLFVVLLLPSLVLADTAPAEEIDSGAPPAWVVEMMSSTQTWLRPHANRHNLQPKDDATVTMSDGELPAEFHLSAAYPNPFNPATTVSVSLPEAAELNVFVFNVAGQKVAELAKGSFAAGIHKFSFDASGIATGLYFIRATVPGKLDEVQKAMLVR